MTGVRRNRAYLGPMQPANPASPPVDEETFGWPPAWREDAAPATPAPPPEPPRARTGVVALTAMLTPLVLIAAFANQWISKDLEDAVSGRHEGVRGLAVSWLTYTWRVTPVTHGRNVWADHLVTVVVTVLLTGLLVLVTARGAVTFWRAFFTTWTAVIVATLAGVFLGGLYSGADSALVHASRVTRAAFGSTAPRGTTVVGAAGLGLVVALITALVAVATRRRPRPAAAAEPAAPPYVAPEPPPPYFGEPIPPTPPYWAQQAEMQQTTQLPRTEPADERTQRLPVEQDAEDLDIPHTFDRSGPA